MVIQNDPKPLNDQIQDAAEKAKQQVQQTAQNLSESAKQTAQNVSDQAKQTAQNVSEGAKQTFATVSTDAGRSATEARRAMRESAYTVKESASDSLLGAAENIRREALKNGNDDVVRQAHQVARSMERAALYLDSHTFDQITSDATEIVRESPWQTVGVVLVVGVLLGMLFGSRHD